MDVLTRGDESVSVIAAAIGDKARARMLYCLMDGHARTATELATAAGVAPPTASVHLNRLRKAELLQLHAQGRHRYYCLSSPQVARVLEGLSVLAGVRHNFDPTIPSRLRDARTCYDHLAGTLGVAIHDRFVSLRWLVAAERRYRLTSHGVMGLESLGIDIAGAQAVRRRFAYPCLDWSERRPHLGGALGASLLAAMRKRKWVTGDLVY